MFPPGFKLIRELRGTGWQRFSGSRVVGFRVLGLGFRGLGNPSTEYSTPHSQDARLDYPSHRPDIHTHLRWGILQHKWECVILGDGGVHIRWREVESFTAGCRQKTSGKSCASCGFLALLTTDPGGGGAGLELDFRGILLPMVAAAAATWFDPQLRYFVEV